MTLRTLVLALGPVLPLAAPAAENPAVVKAMEEYLDFAEYGSSLIWPEQIPGAVNIESRQAIARRGECTPHS